MFQFKCTQIENDLARLGIFIDGIWDETLGGLGAKFKKLQADIVRIIEEEGFKTESQVSIEGFSINIFINTRADSLIIQRIISWESGAWKEMEFLGNGNSADNISKKLKEFLAKTVKFTISETGTE